MNRLLRRLKIGIDRPPPRGQVALASFPRSGNTWVRFLLENATGRRTGSIYQDRVLRRGNTGIAIKTHALDSANYSRAIHLVRNPLDAIESYFYWKLEVAGKTVEWDAHVRQSAEEWRAHTEHWLAAACPTVLVRYEDIHADARGCLRRMLEWLGADASAAVLDRAVEASSIENLRRQTPLGETFFRRGQVGRSAASYSAGQRAYVASQLRPLLQQVGYAGLDGKPDVNE